MGRTNIEIDDELIERVMRRYQLPSKRAAVELALRRLAGEPMSRDEALAMEGTGWSGDLDRLRAPDAVGSPDPVAGAPGETGQS
jgi:Arc/MetJ family transcription regulator